MDSYLGLFQRRCHELEEANVQTKILLESSQADKNHISRVMQQNEKLKNEFQELQLQLARVVSIFEINKGYDDIRVRVQLNPP